MFIDIIGLCAFELSFPDPEPSDVEKIIFFIEKLAHSKGPDIILRKSGSTRLEFSGIYLYFFNLLGYLVVIT